MEQITILFFFIMISFLYYSKLGKAIDITQREFVCHDVDIRNTVENFKKLENCTVIEGFLQILLIDNGKPQDYDHLSFPNLVEITGYLLLYRAFGLNTLGKLFPNLAVIRGNILFHNYAFVVFEMYQLQEIGLSKLTHILRGSVRIEKNPGLCYVDTIDWDQIAKSGKGGHFIKANKKWEECPNSCPESNNCPLATKEIRKSLHLCWNSQKCQKICPVECERHNLTCSLTLECCHKECLGGCNGTSSADCIACRHVTYEGHCMKKCPPNTYEFKGRRCIQEEECKNYSHEITGFLKQKIFWKPFKGHCMQECPSGYIVDDNDKHLCKKCIGKCPKICSGMVIDNVAAAQNFFGCTYINGSLEVQIQGGTNVIKELEMNLNSIQEIQGYLKIARSFPLVSLNFLKSLMIIHGEQLDKKNYAFLVLDNQNLQELWNWDQRKTPLKIKGGKIFFHFNSKLCPSKILELKKYAQILDWDDRDVSPSSNGDRVACDVTNMNVSVYSLTSTKVQIIWDSIRKSLHDFRSLLGYVIYYREAPFKNLSIFEGRDACGTDMWTIRDVELIDDTNDYISYIISNLKPFTQYALYIRTYTTVSGRQGAQSSLIYFKTEPYTPSPPLNIKARSTLHGEIVVSWRPPKFPNGNVTYYIIEGIYEEDSIDFINQRNYCIEPLLFVDYGKTKDEDHLSNSLSFINNYSTISTINDKEDCCFCIKENQKFGVEQDDTEFQIHFEDFLHNNVYFKNPYNSRRRRYLYTTTFIDSSNFIKLDTNIKHSFSQEGDKYSNGFLVQFRRLVYHHTFLVISNLKHFAEYTIEIQACQDSKLNAKSNACSSKAIANVRTLHLGGADDIKESSIHIQTKNVTGYSIFIKWDEPIDPNSLIVAYHIEYKRLNGENHKPIHICIIRENFLRHGGYYIAEILPGNYSLRIRSTSLAGYGNWTNFVYFTILSTSRDINIEIILVFTIMLIILLISASAYSIFRWKLIPRVPDNVNYASINPEYMSAGLVYEPDEWEIPREKIKLLQELGQGSFGMVYKGEIRDFGGKKCIPCAAKTVNETATLRERIEFLQEASVMKAFNCNHIIKLLGVVSKGQPTLVIMELMMNGDLKTYLRLHRPDSEANSCQQSPTLKQILQMAAEIADGMAYLAAKKFVHRDLAARNCMVAEDLTVKIGDFGMTRDIYETDYYRKGGKGLLPVRWMAPESLKDGIFDSQTDVWSYGVVLWEMATLASQPYQGLSNEDVLKFVITGKTMEKPEDCPEKLYNLMAMCWHKNPKARPTFQEIIEMLLPDTNTEFKEVAFYFTQRCTFEMEDRPRTYAHENLLNDHQEIRYFPTFAHYPFEIDSDSILEIPTLPTNDGIVNISAIPSDGSKGSKISTLSNGTLINGHVTLSREEVANS